MILQSQNDRYICTPQYFYSSVNVACEKISNPCFIIFSDDVEWVEKNMNIKGKKVYEIPGLSITERCFTCQNVSILLFLIARLVGGRNICPVRKTKL